MTEKSKQLQASIEKYNKKIATLKQFIREYVHENAALCDEINETQEKILISAEERKFLLKKLCLFEPEVEAAVEKLSKELYNNPPSTSTQANVATSSKGKRNKNNSENGSTATEAKPKKSASLKNQRSTAKTRKKLVQQIPLDPTGRPVFPIELGSVTIHSLGEVVTDRKDFHCEETIYPVGYVSTKIYGSVTDPLQKCVYTCKISDANGSPRFEIASDDDGPPIIGGTPDVCHSLLLQKINDALSLNVVSTRPRGNDFFGLTHPTVLNLIQSSPGARKCTNYKWSKFEVSKNGDQYFEDAEPTLHFDSLQRSIDFCRFKIENDSSEYFETPGNSSFIM